MFFFCPRGNKKVISGSNGCAPSPWLYSKTKFGMVISECSSFVHGVTKRWYLDRMAVLPPRGCIPKLSSGWSFQNVVLKHYFRPRGHKKVMYGSNGCDPLASTYDCIALVIVWHVYRIANSILHPLRMMWLFYDLGPLVSWRWCMIRKIW